MSNEFEIEGVEARYERLKSYALSKTSLKYSYEYYNDDLERLFNKEHLNREDIEHLAIQVLSKLAVERRLKDFEGE